MRRAQLVTPFGVGAMSVLVNGTSVITAGLDHWYEVVDQSALAMEEYQEHDWRLESRLKVSEFRLPPDYRPSGQGSDLRNVRLTVPVLRFPRWSFCIYCKRLELSKLTMKTLVECQDKEHADKKYKPKMSQVPFVAICARGHLDDFPFDKWVHRSANPSCTGTLRLVSRGGGGLEGQVVTCDTCKQERSLRGVTEARFDKNGEEHTNLSDQLVSPEQPYLCGGARPWLAQLDGVCDQPIRGALRAAGNVYFPKVESSIYLPRREGAVSEEVHQLLRHPAVSTTFNNVFQLSLDEVSGGQLRKLLERNVPPELFAPISDDELLAAYQDQFGIGESSGEEPVETPVDAESLTSDDIWRHPEYVKIRETPKDDFLAASDPGLHADLAVAAHEVGVTRRWVRDGQVPGGKDGSRPRQPSPIRRTCPVTHRNAPLTPEGRLRLVLRCQHRPIAHIAAEAGVSRQCLAKWVARYREHGEADLHDRSSAPRCRPTQTPTAVVEQIALMRKNKWSARRIVRELASTDITISVATVTRWLHKLGLHRLDHLDVDGQPLRKHGKITAHWPGHMIHIDVKKVGRIPDGGGWRIHGINSDQARAAARATAKAKVRGARPGYVYLHSAVDGFSRLAYTEALQDETAKTAIGFLFRARVWFAAHGITRFTRIVTDNGSCYRAKDFTRAVYSFAARHQRTKPYTPRHNGKVERYQRTLANELLYARPWTSEEHRRQAIATWNLHYNYHRPHSAAGDQPPASRLQTGVTNVMSNYS